MTKRLLSLLLALCLCLTVTLTVAATPQTASFTPLSYKVHGIELPINASSDAPTAILTDYDEWFAFASGFHGVDAACFSVSGSFEKRALLAVPLCEDGYVTCVETDDTTVYVTCTTIGTMNSSQRYLMIEADPAAVSGKTLCVNTVSLRPTAFATEQAVRCLGSASYADEQVYTSREELRTLAEACYHGRELETVEELSTYDNAFFEKNVLVYTALFTPSSGYDLTIDPYGLVTDDAIVVRRNKTVPSYNDMTFSVIGCYAYLIPMPRSLYNGQMVTVMDATDVAPAPYPQGDSVPYELLYSSYAALSDVAKPYSAILRTYDEWCAAVSADSSLGVYYAHVADEAYFEEHAVVLLHTMDYFPHDKWRVTEVICSDTQLSVVTEWAIPENFYPCYLHERIVLGIAKEEVARIDTVVRHDVHYPSVQTDSYSYDIFPDGTARLTSLKTADSTVVIPRTVDGIEVSALGESLFLRNGTVKTVVVPDTVKVIEQAAFQESRVEQVFLPEGLETIEPQAFFWCVGLDRLVIPSTVTAIGERAIGYGYYTDPAEPDLIPGSVGVREAFTLIADDNAYAEDYAASRRIACKTPKDFPLGDADYSGTVTAADGRILLTNVLQGYITRWTVSDGNANGKADTSDVRLLLCSLVER